MLPRGAARVDRAAKRKGDFARRKVSRHQWLRGADAAALTEYTVHMSAAARCRRPGQHIRHLQKLMCDPPPSCTNVV